MVKIYFGKLIALALLLVSLSCQPADTNEQTEDQAAASTVTNNQLTDAEKAAGWELLFDGKSMDQWRVYKKEAVQGWAVEAGEMIALGEEGQEGHGNDIISKEQFENFELALEWKISKGGNSGIFFNVVEEGGFNSVYETGPEYQLIDDVGFPAKLQDWQASGANYAMHPPAKAASKPQGEYNQSRIVVLNGHVEHWLNGEKVVEYNLWTPEWDSLVRTGKWKEFSGYGQARKGHIALQDHGNKIWFRNIKVKKYESQSLFNGENIDGWEIYGTEKWYVENGNLICESGPDKAYGYLATNDGFKDIDLSLEFKQEADGNSGVFFRSSIEGTKITGWQAEVAPPGHNTGGIYESYGRGWLIQPDSILDQALKMGDWNQMRVQVVDDQVTTWLNGQKMIQFQDEKIGEAAGQIALQIHDGGGIKVRWRNINVLTPVNTQ